MDEKKGLKIKTFQQVFTSIVTWLTSEKKASLTDFTVGSALRTLAEGISLQIEEFYFNMRQNIEYAIETAIYTAFGFEQIQGQYASGFVQLNFNEPLTSTLVIGRGTTVATSLTNSKVLYYKTYEDFQAEIGASSCIVEVFCTEIGTIGNCELGEINTLISGNSLIASVNNITRFTSGVNQETRAEMKSRFKAYLKSLGRATADSIAYGAKTVEGVAGVWVDDNYIGFVNVYCHDKNGDLPEELKTKIAYTLEDYRAGGIEVKVLPVVKHPINLDISLIVKDDIEMSDNLTAIVNLLTDFLNSYEVSTDFFVSDIITLLMTNYKSIIVTIDTNDCKNEKVLSNELIVAGKINVTYSHLSDWR